MAKISMYRIQATLLYVNVKGPHTPNVTALVRTLYRESMQLIGIAGFGLIDPLNFSMSRLMLLPMCPPLEDFLKFRCEMLKISILNAVTLKL